MAHEHLFACKLVWTGAAHGSTKDYASYSREYSVEMEGKPLLRGTAAPVFRGDPSLHNPEDLLVASLAGCHCLSYLALAVRSGIEVLAYEDAARGRMAMHEGKLRFVEVVLAPKVTIAKGSDPDKARALHEKAHSECFIANSVNFPVKNEPEIIVAD
ncbi:OsmC family protein [Pendulispora albinea]|uniref:OsmC family protein n=1 Tax=Pendulispora albinea TaxID=2741071 RepID=A0ABZ2M2E1_9BACT